MEVALKGNNQQVVVLLVLIVYPGDPGKCDVPGNRL